MNPPERRSIVWLQMLPLATVASIGVWLLLTIDRVVITRQLNDALVFLAGMLRVVQGQYPGADYVTFLGPLNQVIPAIVYRWSGDAVVAYLATNLVFAVLAMLLLQRAAANGASNIVHWMATIPVAVLTLTLACVFRSGDISMSYNRWGLGIFCAAIVWLFSRLGSGRSESMLEGIVLGIVFSVLVLVKATFALALGLVAVAFLLFGAFSLQQVIAAAAASLVTLGAVELATGGFLDYVDTLRVMSSIRKPVESWRIERLLDQSRAELALFLLALGVIAILGWRAKRGRTWQMLLLSGWALLVAVWLGSQNDAQHKIVAPLFVALGAASPLLRLQAGGAGRWGVVFAVAGVAPLFFYMTGLLGGAFQAAVTQEPLRFTRDLGEIHSGLTGFLVSTQAARRASPAEIEALGAAATAPFDEYRAALAELGRDVRRPLNVLEELAVVEGMSHALEAFCEHHDRIAAMAWVDTTPLFSRNRYRLGRSFLIVAWGHNVNSERRPADNWLFAETDCVLFPKLFFDGHSDYYLVSFYQQQMEAIGFRKIGEDHYWRVYRRAKGLANGGT